MGSGSSKSPKASPPSAPSPAPPPPPSEPETPSKVIPDGEEATNPPPALPPIRLTYGKVKGRAEPARLLFAAGGIDFEDERIDYDTWKERKEDTPFLHMPYLDFGEVRIAQTPAIVRFGAKLAGLDGSDSGDVQTSAVIDMVADRVFEFFESTMKVAKGNQKSEEAPGFFEIDIPEFLRTLESQLKKTAGTFFAGESMSYADIVLYDYISRMTDLDDDMFKQFDEFIPADRRELLPGEEYPGLKELVDAVGENEGIKSYLAKMAGDGENDEPAAEEEGPGGEDEQPAAEGEEGQDDHGVPGNLEDVEDEASAPAPVSADDEVRPDDGDGA